MSASDDVGSVTRYSVCDVTGDTRVIHTHYIP